MSTVPGRRNGLTPPYSGPQIAAWIALFFTIVEFGIIVAPIMEVAVLVPVTAAFALCVFLVFLFGLRAVATDSVDIHLARHLNDQAKSNGNKVMAPESPALDQIYCHYNCARQKGDLPDEEMKHCWICDTQVAEHSMHCKYCNKCVSNFDHHCLWLNTCIGAANYQDFYRLLLSIFTMQLIHVGVSTWLMIDIFLHGPTEDRADDWLGSSGDASAPIVAVLIFFIIFDVISLMLLAQLIVFHVGLQKERLTTYQYIIRDHKKRRDEAERMHQLDNERLVEFARATEQGRSFYAKRLQLGAKFRKIGCTCLDPLSLPTPEPEPDPNAGFAASLGPARQAHSHSPPRQQEQHMDDVPEKPLEMAASGEERPVDEE